MAIFETVYHAMLRTRAEALGGIVPLGPEYAGSLCFAHGGESIIGKAVRKFWHCEY